jgi:hypothetical protein
METYMEHDIVEAIEQLRDALLCDDCRLDRFQEGEYVGFVLRKHHGLTNDELPPPPKRRCTKNHFKK